MGGCHLEEWHKNKSDEDEIIWPKLWHITPTNAWWGWAKYFGVIWDGFLHICLMVCIALVLICDYLVSIYDVCVAWDWTSKLVATCNLQLKPSKRRIRHKIHRKMLAIGYPKFWKRLRCDRVDNYWRVNLPRVRSRVGQTRIHVEALWYMPLNYQVAAIILPILLLMVLLLVPLMAY